MLSVFCLLCQTCANNEYKELEDSLHSFGNLNSFSEVLIIPNEGCTGCITETTNDVLVNTNDYDETLIIFTKVRDKKMLVNRLGKKLFERPNIKIDTHNVLDKPTLSSIYPQLIILIKGKVEEIEKLN